MVPELALDLRLLAEDRFLSPGQVRTLLDAADVVVGLTAARRFAEVLTPEGVGGSTLRG